MSDSKKRHFTDILADFSVAMLVTVAPDGTVRGRPMQIASKEADSDVWFVTGVNSGKVDEIRHDSHVGIMLQDASRWVSISGKAALVRDRAKIDQLWEESWRVWFPEGKDDPDLALLKVDTGTAEFWDNSGTLKLKYIFKAGRAYLSGDTPTSDESMHAKVNL